MRFLDRAGEFKAILLDVDGTLVDSNEAHVQAWYEAINRVGMRISLDDLRRTIGMGGDRLLPALAGVEKETYWGKKISDAKKKAFNRRLPHVRALPGAKELLECAAHAGIQSRIITSAEREECLAILKAAKLDASWVGGILSANEAPSSKPDPLGIFKALDELSLEPHQAFYVGDTPYDLDAARTAGTASVAFRTGYWNDRELCFADWIMDGPAELAAQLNGLLGQKAA